ncbi:VOC family protein [Caulobacter sp. Root342]|jgi:3,4-dihydroxy-9,10-secoandrosta-1,3,5(10)-triene-9,17-dione 4,5-dioxygenase|uniref:VOC family protein n=1 Tax=Caulobacter sp. Root342 TaxID=1736519 RepID=UPI0006F4CA3E|nr:VOC family protein [Caulobacter sp. Root342]KQV54724.1 hypothetical protein ASC62_23340 [Caulobacter sp. Root342]
MGVTSLGYVVIETRDLEAWRKFAGEILGLMVTPGPDADTLWLRMDDRPFRLWIQKSEREAFVRPAWEFADAEAFEAALAALEKAGRPVERLPDALAHARRVYAAALSTDTADNAIELYYGRFLDYAPFVSPVGISGFVTGESGELGMGHVVLSAPNFDETHAFYKSVLGFADTDLGRFYLAGGGPDDPGVGFAFLHARNGRHHSLALGEMPTFDSGAVHIMLEAATLNDVGRAYDRVLASKTPVSATLGRHVNDKMVSFYVKTPGGFDLEFGCEGLIIDPATWVATTSLAVSDWGHAWSHQQEG